MQQAPPSGLLEWSNAVRLFMANDPGRQLFQEQINTHGFDFLQDYIDNILSGAKQDPLIELVKTPGRRKVASKKPKLLSKLNNSIPLSFEGESSKENLAPTKLFHKTLLSAKNDQEPATRTFPSPELNPSQEKYELERGLLEPGASSTVIEHATASSVVDQSLGPAKHTDLLVPSHPEQNELSVIAEDDENAERSRASIQLSASEYHASPAPPHEQESNTTRSSSDTFHSINLDSPQYQVAEKIPSPPPNHFPHEVHGTYVQDHSPIEDITPSLPDLPDVPIRQSFATRDIQMPMIPPTTSVPEILSVAGPSSPGVSSFDSKASVSLFPILPAPMPLRKSMRAPRDPSVEAVTPGAGLAGKRTSWLKKAREVKALEGTGRNGNINATTSGTSSSQVSLLSNGLKRKSGDALIPSSTGLEDEERRHKSAKTLEDDVAPLKPKVPEVTYRDEGQLLVQPQPKPAEQEGMLDRFKRTVEDLGARVGRSVGKSLGAAAATSALAEARAAAEARVAERNQKEDEMTRTLAFPATIPAPDQKSPVSIPEIPPINVEKIVEKPLTGEGIERRMSISDLFPLNDENTKMKSKGSERLFQFSPLLAQQSATDRSKVNRESTTTTPPDSPPPTRPTSFAGPTGPVFNKPPPVFVPPAPPGPAAVPLPKQPNSLSAHSTLESVKSQSIFDDDGEVPAWAPATQDTTYSSTFDSQSQGRNVNVLDEDDSWPMDEKLGTGVQWTFGGGKEDSMTWSTLPSQSQRADTGPMQTDDPMTQCENELPQASHGIPDVFELGMDDDEYDEDKDLDAVDSDLEDIIMAGKSTISLVDSKPSETQTSMTSSASSQSQAGFLGQASKLLNSALGTSKKGKPEVKKVLQMAAVAAKKQQEENDKKAARLKEMESRRQLAIQRKAEEEKAKVQEQEKKLKEEGERRKREREENTDKRPLKTTSSTKKDAEDTTKKRKITVDIEKKPDLKKPTSKPTLKSSMKQPTALSSSAVYNASLQTIAASTSKQTEVKQVETKPVKPIASQKGRALKVQIAEDDLSQPSQLVQIQMAARAKAQLQAAKAAQPSVESESIELPDINSEYSDSEDEDRPRTFNPPDWAQSPELRQALQVQSTINPDDIFGVIRPLRMEELFKTRTSRFRARTSSANWTGADRLTAEEEREYARRMGFK